MRLKAAPKLHEVLEVTPTVPEKQGSAFLRGRGVEETVWMRF